MAVSQALANGLADVPPDRIAGVILITDGVVHDIYPEKNAGPSLGFPARRLPRPRDHGAPDTRGRDRQIRGSWRRPALRK